VMALRHAAARGFDTKGATAYVTLEPCAHHGRTPPCCDALIAAGLAQVHLALQDPFPAVSGQGEARLRAAGIEVLGPAHEGLASAARELNVGFLSRVTRGLPWLRLKAATSLDGRTALPNGQSQWLTGEEARLDGHAWRRRASAVLTGVGTVLADNPRLNVRGFSVARQPTRVILDRRLRTPPHAALLDRSEGGPVCIYTLAETLSDPSGRQRAQSLEWGGAEIRTWPAHTEPSGQASGSAGAGTMPAAPPGDVEAMAGKPESRALQAVLQDLAHQGVNELHVEAGAVLNGALLQAGLVDELLIYMAPFLLGPGRALADLPTLPDLGAATRWSAPQAHLCGQDLRLRMKCLG
jgi:diaminohydroxyphosphoribosylaminopyrimidine deaminase/5-amino-6-(5-phosphoribosylamino)uracil reductase